MRIALLFAASVLVAGCSQLSGQQPRATQLTPITPSRAAGPVSSSATTTASTPSPAPKAGAPVAEAIRWVEAAGPVDGADFYKGSALLNDVQFEGGRIGQVDYPIVLEGAAVVHA